MKLNTIIFFLLAIAYSTHGQQKLALKNKSLSEEQIITKYLENGAWRFRYFAPEYQLYIDSAIALNPTIAYLYQQKSMPLYKQGKYSVGLQYLNKAVELAPVKYIDYRAFMKCIFAKNYTEALDDFILSKKLKSENGYVMDHSYNFYIGLCYIQLNEYQKAFDYLNKSIRQVEATSGEKWCTILICFMLALLCKKCDSTKKLLLISIEP